jgi:hypothetical protein
LISSRAHLSLSFALFREEEEEKKKHKKRNNDTTETTTVRKKKTTTTTKRGKEERETRRHRLVTSFSKGNSGHQKLSLHFPFRVFELEVKNTRKRTTQIFSSSSSSE